MYTWSNEQHLDTLNVSGKSDILEIKAKNEHAIIQVENRDIKSVVFKDLRESESVTLYKKDAKHIIVGENNWKRDVYHYLKPGGPAPTIRLGITKHIGEGTWSSLPHDFELNTEPGFEEVFFYLLNGSTQKAIQRGKGVWHTNEPVDDGWLVDDRTFGTVPMGYHPVVGEPGVKVSYIWVYLCKKLEWEKI